MIRIEEWADIVAAHHRGVPIKEIARLTSLSRNTVRETICSESAPAHKRPPTPNKLDPYKDYPLQRVDELPRISAEKLFAEIRSQKCRGGKTIPADFTCPCRATRLHTSGIRVFSQEKVDF